MLLVLSQALWAGFPEDLPPIQQQDISDEDIIGLFEARQEVLQNDDEKAIEKYLPLARAGVLAAQIALSDLYAEGIKKDQSFAREAVRWAYYAARANDWTSQLRLAAYYLAGTGVREDPVRAQYWLDRAFASGHIEGRNLYQKITAAVLRKATSEAAAGNTTTAESLALPLADAELWQAQKWLAFHYAKHSQKDELIRYWFRRSVRSAPSTEKVGLLHEFSLDRRLAAYVQEVISAWKMSGRKEDSALLFLQSQLLLDSTNAKTVQEGVVYLKRSARAGNADAQYQLGILFLHGKRLPKDERKSLFWFEKAVKQGNKEAARILSVLMGRQISASSQRGGRGAAEDLFFHHGIKWLENLPGKGYTLQLASLSNEGEARAAIQHFNLTGGFAWFEHGGRHILIRSYFQTLAQARQYVSSVRKKNPDFDPWIRRVGPLKALVMLSADAKKN